MVKIAMRSIGVQTDASEEALEAPEEENEISFDALMKKFLASMPLKNLEAVHMHVKEPRINTVPSLRPISIPTEALLSATFENPVLPIVLSTLEQPLILRYLRSRCHSCHRLQTEGYFLGSGFMPDSIYNRRYKASIQRCEFRDTPQMVLPAARKISAIAIDCEMVGVRGGRQTLAFLTAIDFLTGEVLINRYVDPVEEVVNWRFEVSGVTQTIMAGAVAAGEAFGSWREARDKLWEFMDESTVLVGHSLKYDLEVLGMCHAKVVDSAILISETVYPSAISTRPLPRQWGLKTLAKDFLSLAIQTSNFGHSALEDTYATRDVVIWCIMNPEKLKLWAENARRQEEEHKIARKQQRQAKRRSKGKSPAIQFTQARENQYGRDEDSENINWSDFAEEHGWPRDYDPSD